MKVLVLGGGGREHALAWKLRQSRRVEAVFALPGSDGMAAVATAVAGDPCDAATVLAAIARHAIDLTVVGPEAPLAAGIVDAVSAAGHLIFGPSRAAAQLEASKTFAKEFMAGRHIPTARFACADDPAGARRALARFGLPAVIKADGLAAGKGVVIASDASEAERALEAMLGGSLVGEAGRRVVIEECLHGPELSVLAVCDGERWIIMPAARDHKRLRDGDAGPNTGGMGAYSTDALLPRELRERVEETVIGPVLAGMAHAATPFQGVLYTGLMLTREGPRVLEFNARFGDPETQPILMRWNGDLGELLRQAAQGRIETQTAAPPAAAAAACIIAAAAGYPDRPRRGDHITGLDAAPKRAMVFHAGTRRDADGGWETNGGRVLGVTALGERLDSALAAAYGALAGINFEGMQYRTDIGKDNQSTL
ncbi:MAG TPA: phosphoribosylamine--glycine ligase [Terriglobales bacterium]|nr:phosphoribosylamine--glycine ligase [Terriglobales bacterium]